MATGKTTIGARLATQLGLPFHDSDAEIEAATGASVRELAQSEGAGAMHAREAAQLLAVLHGAATTPCVEAAAASTIDDDACRAALRAACVVWLRASSATILSRFDHGDHRPTFGLPPARLVARQLAQRGPRFASVADVVVDVDGKAPAAIVTEIVAALGP